MRAQTAGSLRYSAHTSACSCRIERDGVVVARQSFGVGPPGGGVRVVVQEILQLRTVARAAQAKTRGSVHIIFAALASVFGRSRSGSKRLPASSTTTAKPCA